MKIKVCIKEPGGAPRCVCVSEELSNLQKIVGGYIETVTIAKDLVVICNEEGRLMGLPHCCDICGIQFVGPIILAGVRRDELTDIPVSYQALKRLIPGLWE